MQHRGLYSPTFAGWQYNNIHSHRPCSKRPQLGIQLQQIDTMFSSSANYAEDAFTFAKLPHVSHGYLSLARMKHDKQACNQIE